MKKYLLALLLFTYFNLLYAQPAKKNTKKEKATTQKNVDKMMEDAMKAAGMSKAEIEEAKIAMQQGIHAQEVIKQSGVQLSTDGSDIKIPVKQTKLLLKIPSLSTAQQYATYINSLLLEAKTNILPNIITAAENAIEQNKNDMLSINNLSIAMLLKKQIATAVYTSIRVVQLNPNQTLLQHNLAFILHQAGYPQKAIPLLQFLLKKYNTAALNNNLGQCYLSLGNKENAKSYLLACLLKEPMYYEANLGMGWLLTDEGKLAEANIYIAKALKNGYSTFGETLAEKNKLAIKFSDIKQKVPDYFNPQKFKPAPSASNMEEVQNAIEQRNELDGLAQAWFAKTEIIKEAYNNANNTEDLTALMKQHIGYISNAPFARKAKWMIQLLNEEIMQHQKDYPKKEYLAKEEGYYKKLTTDLDEMYKGNIKYESSAAECKKKVEILNAYLKNSSANYDNYERANLHKFYDWTNQALYWQSILLNDTAYKVFYHQQINQFYHLLNSYKDLQSLYPTASWIASNCNNYKDELEKIKREYDSSFATACAINIKANLKIATWKTSCTGMEIEGGELAVFGFEKDNKSGEFQLSFGLGADINAFILSLGVKGQMYFRFDKDFSPIDMGIKFEAGGEAKAGTYTIEEKMVAAMGISSIHINAVNAGKEINIFSVDAVKD
jgi:hypothetical protein